MKSLKKLRPAVIVLVLATAFSVAAKCDGASTACAATAAIVAVTPPEPIEDGSYRDGSHEEGEAPPEPVEDGSYTDGSEDENDAQDDASGC
ncbi:hypothetical protein [Streptosporangium sp. NPDC000509]|uniref:hypothetical protein n=1 Tax=Streptosporangium sp. NPDC000509 TaxID=3366186 RepID=UPI003681986B